MLLKETVEQIVKEIIAVENVYLVDILISESKIRNKITVFIDNEAGIQIDECGEISKKLGVALEEVIEKAFTLEVSSPGADAPIKLDQQYKKNVGRNIKIVDFEGIETVGLLEDFENGELSIQPEKVKKVLPEKIKINIKNIKLAKAVISFK